MRRLALASAPLASLLLGLTLLAGVLGRPAAAQAEEPVTLRYARRQGWSLENGLPQNSVRDLLQARDGALWIATHGGLARFNGREFEVFNDANTPGLGSSFLCALLEDRSGRLWIASAEGTLSCRANGRFRAWTRQDGVPVGETLSLAELPDGSILVGGEPGLFRLRGERLEPFVAGGELVPRQVHHLYVEPDGTLWCAAGNGLFVLRDGAFERVEFDDGRPYAGANFVTRMADTGLWAKTNLGLATVEGGALHHLRPAGADPGTNWGVSGVIRNADGGILIATGKSFLILRIERGVAFFTAHAMQDVDASALLLDREENMWIGYMTRGLEQLVRTPTLPVTFESLKLKRGNLLMAPASAQEAWIGSTESNDLRRVDPAQGTVTGRQSLPHNAQHARGLLTSADGSLWIAHDEGLRILHGDDVEDLDVRVPAYATPMLQDAAGAVWIGGRGMVVRVAGGEAQRFGTEVGFPRDAEAAALAEQPAGTLWVGTSTGLLRLDGGRFTAFTRADGLPGGTVRALVPRPDGSLWLGTYGGGLARWKDGRFARVDSSRGLYSDAVSRIEDDGQGHLWVNSNRGVFRVRLSDLEHVADESDEAVACLALRTRESGGFGGLRLATGTLLFATIEGLVIVEPERVTARSIPPSVELSRVVADGRALDAIGTLTIPPGPRELVFRFAGISLTEPEAVRYRYRLVGFDPVWRQGGPEGSARYTNVPPGDYRFEVLARSYDGTWSEAPAGVDLVLEPFVHETVWFQLSVLLLVVASVLFAFERRARAALRRQHALQREVDLRTRAEDSLRLLTGRLIRAQEEERRRVALELHDDLGQRLAFLGVGLDVLARDPRVQAGPQAGDGLGGELAALADAVKSISTDVHGMSHRLHSTKLDKLGLRAALRSLCKEMSEQHQIAIEFQALGDGPPPPAEVGLSLYRIAQESLRNAVRHSDASSVQVELDEAAGAVRLVVADDGRGFDRAAREKHVGLGLQGMQERVRLVGGTLTLASAPGQGTRIEAEIPVGQAAHPADRHEDA